MNEIERIRELELELADVKNQLHVQKVYYEDAKVLAVEAHNEEINSLKSKLAEAEKALDRGLGDGLQMGAGLLMKLKEECEKQYDRAESLEKELAGKVICQPGQHLPHERCSFCPPMEPGAADWINRKCECRHVHGVHDVSIGCSVDDCLCIKFKEPPSGGKAK